MRPFATVEDLASGWRELTEEELAMAPTMLERASAQLAWRLSKHGVTIDPSDEVQATNLIAVTCNMVRRAMPSSYDGFKTLAQSVGSTNVSLTLKDNDGSFFITRDEKDMLGISGRGKLVMLRPAIRNPDGTPVEGW